MQSKGQGRISAQTNVSASPNNSIKKSLRNIREKSHQEFYNNRASKLGSIFTQNGFDLDGLVTEDELLTFLDTLGKEPFNREIAAQLFEKLPFHESGDSGDFRRFILRDFIDTHIKAEYLLLIRAEEIEGEMDTVYNQIEGLRDQFLEVAKKSEARVENNTLQVDIVEVVCDDEDYEAEVGSVFSVVVLVGNYKYETDEIVIEQPEFNPKFNWTFHFKFDTPDEKMQILLRDQNRFATDDDYNDLKCTINLKNYKDQIKHVTWLTLYNAYQQPTKFKVHLDIQWQFSKLAFHEEKFGELQVLEEKLNDEKEYIETSIKLLVHPFAFASSKTRGVSQGMKLDSNVRLTQSVTENPGARQTYDPYSQTKEQSQPRIEPAGRLAQSHYSEQNAEYYKPQLSESKKSSAMMSENYRVAESLQSSKNPTEPATSEKNARVTQSYQPYQPQQQFQSEQNSNAGGFRKLETFSSQGNDAMVGGGGNVSGSTNQQRFYGGIGGGLANNNQDYNNLYRAPSDASETSIKRIAAKNPFDASASDSKGRFMPQTTGQFGMERTGPPVDVNNSYRRTPSNQSEKSLRSPFEAEANVGIQPKRFENVRSGNQSRDQAELKAEMQMGQSYMSNQSGRSGRIGSDPLNPQYPGYSQSGYKKNPSNFA